ncbi:MAG: DUF2510 domain-containing protein [Actinomycetota bacterium]|nr:DUF2510 domain-containing protein [Actinomycetota bacterium]
MTGPHRVGWYEDPSGEPGLFCYWDGVGWGQRTRTPPDRPALPMRAAPAPAGGRTGSAPSRSIGAILAVAVLLFAVAVLAWVLIR